MNHFKKPILFSYNHIRLTVVYIVLVFYFTNKYSVSRHIHIVHRITIYCYPITSGKFGYVDVSYYFIFIAIKPYPLPCTYTYVKYLNVFISSRSAGNGETLTQHIAISRVKPFFVECRVFTANSFNIDTCICGISFEGDCPPSLGLLTLNALTAADYLIIPVQAQFLAMRGMAKIMNVIATVQERLNPKLAIGGIVITQFDKRKTLNKSVAELVKDSFCDKVFKTVIRDNVSLAEAPIKGKNIFEYSKNSNGAKDYMALAQEVLKLK